MLGSRQVSFRLGCYNELGEVVAFGYVKSL
jgi:hypothetical protein